MDNINMQELISFINWEELRIRLYWQYSQFCSYQCRGHPYLEINKKV